MQQTWNVPTSVVQRTRKTHQDDAICIEFKIHLGVIRYCSVVSLTAFFASFAAVSIMLTQFKVNTDTQTVSICICWIREYVQGTKPEFESPESSSKNIVSATWACVSLESSYFSNSVFGRPCLKYFSSSSLLSSVHFCLPPHPPPPPDLTLHSRSLPSK